MLNEARADERAKVSKAYRILLDNESAKEHRRIVNLLKMERDAYQGFSVDTPQGHTWRILNGLIQKIVDGKED